MGTNILAFEQFRQFLYTITPITNSDFEKSISFFRTKDLKKSEVWVDYNTVCREIAFIKKGLLKTSYFDERGLEITSCFCTPNSMASSFKSFLNQSPSQLAIHALEETSVLTIHHGKLHKLFQEIPVWERLFRIIMEKEYEKLWDYTEGMKTELAKERYQKLLDEQPEVIQKAPVQDIATYLGITRETLSRIRKKTP